MFRRRVAAAGREGQLGEAPLFSCSDQELLLFGVGFGAGLEFFFDGAACWELGFRMGVMGSVARRALGRGGCGLPGSFSFLNCLACEGVSGSAKLS